MSAILSDTGRSLEPQAYKLDGITITNYTGVEKDIRNFVDNFEIRESLYTPTLILEMVIADLTNFMEDFAISGQEKIKIELTKHPIHSEDPTILSLDFYVTEYPAFLRDSNRPDNQAYMLRGVSKHAYESRMRTISRAYTNNSTLEIARILINDLGFPANKVSFNSQDSTTHQGIINIQEPLQAIEHLRKAAYDDKGSPFFVYQTLNGNININSFAGLVDDTKNPVFNGSLGYQYKKGYAAAPQTKSLYNEQASRILNVTSKLGMAKAFQAVKGAFASTVVRLDVANKKRTVTSFDYHNPVHTILRETTLGSGQRSTISPQFKIGKDESEKLSDFDNAHIDFISTNSLSHSGAPNYNRDIENNLHYLNSYNALMDSVAQQIRVCGNLFLNPGRKILCIFPKSMEKDAYKGWTSGDYTSEHIDTLNSGKYLVVSAVHNFKVGGQGQDEHFTNLSIVKDSVFSEGFESQ